MSTKRDLAEANAKIAKVREHLDWLRSIAATDSQYDLGIRLAVDHMLDAIFEVPRPIHPRWAALSSREGQETP